MDSSQILKSIITTALSKKHSNLHLISLMDLKKIKTLKLNYTRFYITFSETLISKDIPFSWDCLIIEKKYNWAAVVKRNVEIIDQISLNWDITVEERIILYKRWIELMSDIREHVTAYKLMLKAIELIGGSKQLLSNNEDFVKKVIIQAFQHPDIAQFNVLFNLPAVQTLIPYEEIGGYEKWEVISKKFMDNTGSESGRYNKLIYLMFCSHSFKDRKISYDEIAKIMNINKDEVEEFITDAIIGNILDARIDQENECLIVNSMFSHKEEKEIHKCDIWQHVIKYMAKIYSSSN